MILYKDNVRHMLGFPSIKIIVPVNMHLGLFVTQDRGHDTWKDLGRKTIIALIYLSSKYVSPHPPS